MRKGICAEPDCGTRQKQRHANFRCKHATRKRRTYHKMCVHEKVVAPGADWGPLRPFISMPPLEPTPFSAAPRAPWGPPGPPPLPPEALARLVASTRGHTRRCFVRTIMNGWCTSRRLHAVSLRDCLFCGAAGQDRLHHYLECPAFRDAFGCNGISQHRPSLLHPLCPRLLTAAHIFYHSAKHSPGPVLHLAPPAPVPHLERARVACLLHGSPHAHAALPTAPPMPLCCIVCIHRAPSSLV